MPLPSLSGFTAAWWFLLLIPVALLAVGYVLAQRRRRRNTMRFTNLDLLERVAPKRPGWPRHVPMAMLLVALVLLTVALAGPTAAQRVPRNRATVMLTVDVSLSMKATDIQPNRLAAAQKSASSFAEGLTKGVNLGLISFAASATVLVPPTTDRDAVKQNIANLRLAESTATGDALNTAMQTVQSFGKTIGGADGPPPARIVLMSDGKEIIGAHRALDVAKDAKRAHIPITTISFGTKFGEVDIDGTPQRVPVDDESMKEIAELSGGDFYKAASAEQLQQVYDTLGNQIGFETKFTDASRPWLVLGALAAIVAAGAAVLINQRLP